MQLPLNQFRQIILVVEYPLLYTLYYLLSLQLEVNVLGQHFLPVAIPINEEMEVRLHQVLVYAATPSYLVQLLLDFFPIHGKLKAKHTLTSVILQNVGNAGVGLVVLVVKR